MKFNELSTIQKFGYARHNLLWYIHDAFPTRHFKHGKHKRLRKAR